MSVVVLEYDELKRLITEELRTQLADDLKNEIRNALDNFKPKENPPVWITIKEAAQDYNRDELTIRRWASNGKLKAKKIGGTVYVKSKMHAEEEYGKVKFGKKTKT